LKSCYGIAIGTRPVLITIYGILYKMGSCSLNENARRFTGVGAARGFMKSYLVSKRANASRIEATGYGETQPIASNKTAKVRQLNRRVEFILF
jgi:hypothetical protein